MKARALLAILLSCGVAPLVLDRATRVVASDDVHHQGLLDRGLMGGATRVLPGLRALIVQVWLARIDAALRRNDRSAALRFAREALAIGPDLALGRIRVAERFAFSFAPNERGSAQNVAWIEEAVALLDEGIVRDPRDAALHHARGILVWLRGLYVPEFAAAFRAATGTTTLQSATDSLVRAVELARFDFDNLVAASSLLCARAESFLDEAKTLEDGIDAGSGERFERLLSTLAAARRDFERAADYLATLEALAGTPGDSLRNTLEMARTSAELIGWNEELARGHAVDSERVARLRARRIELRAREQEAR